MLFKYNLRIVFYWAVSMFLGLTAGSALGIFLGNISYGLAVSEGLVLLFTLIFLGLAMIVWLSPLENKFFISKIKKLKFDINNANHKYGLPPMLLFLLAGCLVGEKHFYNVALGKHCLLPVMCPGDFCLLQYCF